MNSWLSPLDIGLVMGLIFSWAVLGMALSFRLFNFPTLPWKDLSCWARWSSLPC